MTALTGPILVIGVVLTALLFAFGVRRLLGLRLPLPRILLAVTASPRWCCSARPTTATYSVRKRSARKCTTWRASSARVPRTLSRTTTGGVHPGRHRYPARRNQTGADNGQGPPRDGRARGFRPCAGSARRAGCPGRGSGRTAQHRYWKPAPSKHPHNKNVQQEGWYTVTVGRFALQVTPNPGIAKFVEDKL